MHKQIFVNLPVKNLPKSMSFFKELGYSFDVKFTNEQAACMILGENLHVMLLTENFFQGFTSKPISDATKQSEVLVCVSCDSRAQVDNLVAKASAGGATTPRPSQDHGFMYGHGFHDLDGHIWEFVYMEPQST
ncbi:glyoxalase-like domain protein [Collimonas arenae]|uniref:Glyoxalase-like domain protein n=1 Tax=Collimonas arenae TaxID=279058 RepID=A0A127PQD7_9BURK|nr:VOC family protein [Collimonas arenae]AMP00017.1 glyoxalase-like domain protein [Collimonas arenae]AMP09909.1 glyoxalase-like domain protein [Collimonas arenae]